MASTRGKEAPGVACLLCTGPLALTSRLRSAFSRTRVSNACFVGVGGRGVAVQLQGPVRRPLPPPYSLSLDPLLVSMLESLALLELLLHVRPRLLNRRLAS